MRTCVVALAGLVALSVTPASWAALGYSDTFDAGSSPFTASAYYLNAAQQNGLIVKTTTGTTSFPGQVPQDVGGAGFFLFNGILNQVTPAGQTAFYVSPSFAVAPNTPYALSFYLANANFTDNGPGNPLFAQVQPQVNGVAVGATFSATGIWATTGWQQFTFPFDSGPATSAVVTLQNFRTNGPSGNDFAIDNVVVQTVPEPVGVGMLAFGGVVAIVRRRRSRRPG